MANDNLNAAARKVADAFIELLNVAEDDGRWEDAARAYRAAYLDEMGARGQYVPHPSDHSLPYVIAGLKAARALLPESAQ